MAVVDEAPASFTQADYSTALTKLLEFGHSSPLDRRIGQLFDGQAGEWETPILNAFILHGHRDENGTRLIDRFLATRGRLLSIGVIGALRTLQRARASLFEVEKVQRGKGFDAVDLLSGEKVHIHEVTGTAQLKKWDVLLSWVMEREGQLQLTGASCFIPRQHLDRVLVATNDALAEARAAHPGIADRDLVGLVSWAPIRALRTGIEVAATPNVRTTDGEEIVICRSHFAAMDVEAVRSRLAALEEMEPDDAGFVWVDREPSSARPRGQKSGRGRRQKGLPTVLGRITIEGGDVVLETMSRERSTRGRDLLERTLGSAITHRMDTLQDMLAAMESSRARASTRKEPVPDAEEREVIGSYLRDYYTRWLDEPVPALGNKTPRNAARTKKGRAQVAALLKDIENGTLSQVGDAVDFAALRRELGLE